MYSTSCKPLGLVAPVIGKRAPRYFSAKISTPRPRRHPRSRTTLCSLHSRRHLSAAVPDRRLASVLAVAPLPARALFASLPLCLAMCRAWPRSLRINAPAARMRQSSPSPVAAALVRPPDPLHPLPPRRRPCLRRPPPARALPSCRCRSSTYCAIPAPCVPFCCQHCCQYRCQSRRQSRDASPDASPDASANASAVASPCQSHLASIVASPVASIVASLPLPVPMPIPKPVPMPAPMPVTVSPISHVLSHSSPGHTATVHNSCLFMWSHAGLAAIRIFIL